MRRGQIRTGVLAVLGEGAGHGYDVIRRLEDKAGGAWRPSPGSVYPLLQLLADEGLVSSTERDGRRIYELTAAGRTESSKRLAEAVDAPWERGQPAANITRDEIRLIVAAIETLTRVGSDDLRARATAIVQRARKELYGLLAND
jgi:DNA-binding PadR family transcriptional regulator